VDSYWYFFVPTVYNHTNTPSLVVTDVVDNSTCYHYKPSQSITYTVLKPGIQRAVQALADILRSALCCHSKNPMHWLQNCPIVHDHRAPPTIPSSYIQIRSVVWECGNGQTDTQTVATNTHFVSATPHAKWNDASVTVTTKASCSQLQEQPLYIQDEQTDLLNRVHPWTNCHSTHRWP